MSCNASYTRFIFLKVFHMNYNLICIFICTPICTNLFILVKSGCYMRSPPRAIMDNGAWRASILASRKGIPFPTSIPSILFSYTLLSFLKVCPSAKSSTIQMGKTRLYPGTQGATRIGLASIPHRQMLVHVLLFSKCLNVHSGCTPKTTKVLKATMLGRTDQHKAEG
jgi:hypothetical protein